MEDAGISCAEFIEFCISQSEQEGFRKRQTELEVARDTLLKESTMSSNTNWRRNRDTLRAKEEPIRHLESIVDNNKRTIAWMEVRFALPFHSGVLS